MSTISNVVTKQAQTADTLSAFEALLISAESAKHEAKKLQLSPTAAIRDIFTAYSEIDIQTMIVKRSGKVRNELNSLFADLMQAKQLFDNAQNSKERKSAVEIGRKVLCDNMTDSQNTQTFKGEKVRRMHFTTDFVIGALAYIVARKDS